MGYHGLMAVMADLQRKGLIRHIGLSNGTAAQIAEARAIADIVCVQNHYNLAHRDDDALIDSLAGQGIAYVPFFPLGGFTPLQSSTLSDVAGRVGATPMQVALAWLLHRSPNILLIPGTSSYRHVTTKAELRDLVVGRWLEATMPPLRAIASLPDPAPERLRRLFDTLIALKRRRAADDPELFATYRALAADARTVAASHIDELVGLAAMVIRSGVEEGTFRTVDPVATGRAVLVATSRFHHSAHAAEWVDPAIDTVYDGVWQLLMDGLCVTKTSGTCAHN